jgi:endoglucanase
VFKQRLRSRLGLRFLACAVFLTAVPAAEAANPFGGARLWVDPGSNAAADAARLRHSDPVAARLLRRIADRPQAIWLGDWTRDPRAEVARQTRRITAAKALPLFVAYNILLRDCGSYSAGGAESATAYRRWIRGLAAGIGRRRAVVILEPDALAGIDCLGVPQRAERMRLLAYAVRAIEARPRAAVYVDAGHSAWQPAAQMGRRLRRAGVARARGFSLNVSNFRTTASQVRYGRRVSRAAGGKHFVIDTSRNGRGPAAGGEWCNPPGRGLGTPPRTRRLPSRLVDALLWVKRPGESDGTCNGGPAAGAWWRDYALGLARRASG